MFTSSIWYHQTIWRHMILQVIAIRCCISIWSPLSSSCICTRWRFLSSCSSGQLCICDRLLLGPVHHQVVVYIIIFFLFDVCWLLWSLLIHIELLLQRIIVKHHELLRGLVQTATLQVLLIVLIDFCVWVDLLPTLAFVSFLYHRWRVVADLLQHLDLFLPIKLPFENVIMRSFLL